MQLGAFSISLAVRDVAASRDFDGKLGFVVIGGQIEQDWRGRAADGTGRRVLRELGRGGTGNGRATQGRKRSSVSVTCRVSGLVPMPVAPPMSSRLPSSSRTCA